jgi:hypothetical protein
MIRRLRLAPLFLLLCISGYSQAPQPKPLRVLFIGNSYTYFNNLPEVLAKLAEAGHQKKVEFVMEAPGGWRLQDHWDRGEARKAIKGQRWDYVVLQDQSQLGDNHVINGKPRITTDENFHSAAVEMAKAIRDTGAIPVFYLTWAKKAVPEDQAMLNNAYFRAAKETKSIVAPVGVAWADVRSKDPSLNSTSTTALTPLRPGPTSLPAFSTQPSSDEARRDSRRRSWAPPSTWTRNYQFRGRPPFWSTSRPSKRACCNRPPGRRL